MEDIKDYFLLGDLHTACLVSSRGSVDWLCFPHFDSASFFARILDLEKGGCFSVVSEEVPEAAYDGSTAIVKLEFQDFTLCDFMVPRPVEDCKTHLLVRKLKARTDCTASFRFDPRPDYGKTEPEIKKEDNLLALQAGGADMLLHLPENARARREERHYLIEIPLERGEEKQLVLEYAEKRQYRPEKDYENDTRKFWEEWVSQGTFFDFCRDELIRSAISLKLMQFYPTGAIVAAPTTSLPEDIGGVRNWDYRYVWIRDATFTLYALHVLGYTEEARRFFHFIEGIVKDCEDCEIDVNLICTIHGKEVGDEQELEHLSGYRNSSPVRIGNGASRQFQLDVYGSLIDAYYFMERRGVSLTSRSKDIITAMVGKIASRWQEEDCGIWEVRQDPQDYAYSKVMAWVGVNRAYRIADSLGISQATKKQWDFLQKEIEEWTWDNCFDGRTFQQYPGSGNQDATNLLFVLLQFLNRHEELTRRIIEETCRELLHKNAFVYRYLNEDGLKGDEGAFILCSYWLISALAMVGETEWAEDLFWKLHGKIANSRLISEEMDPETFGYLGNHPQAFSHIGYIMSAFYLNKYRQKFDEKIPEKPDRS